MLGALLLSSGLALLVTATPATAGESGQQKRGDDCDSDRERAVAKKKDDDCDDDGDDCDSDERVVAKKKDDDCDDDGDDCDVVVMRSVGKKDDDCVAPDPEVTFVDPSCVNENTATWSGSGEHSTFTLVDGTVGPGQEVTVEANADPGWEYDNGETSEEFNYTFGPAVDLEGPPCVIVEPPTEVTTADPTFYEPTCAVDPSMGLPDPVEEEVTQPSRVAEQSVQPGDVIDLDGVRYTVTGDLVPGGTVYVDASALPGYVIAEGATTHWEHAFSDPECTVVEPPQGEVLPEVVTPTVVAAGVGARATDYRSAGQVLVGVGLALLVVAGTAGTARLRRVTG